MITNATILKIVKGDLVDAQKAFARNPNSVNWERTTRSMLVYQQLEQLIRRTKHHSGIKTQLSNLDMISIADWPERIVKISLDMTIAEVLNK
jgi:hypothetical protein